MDTISEKIDDVRNEDYAEEIKENLMNFLKVSLIKLKI